VISLSASYDIVFTIDVEGTENITAASAEVTDFTTNLQSSTEASEEQAEATGGMVSGFTDFGFALSGVINAMQFYEMWTLRMEMAQDTLQARQDSLQNAQINYNLAVEKYGPASEEAIKAHNNLQNAEDYLTRTQERLNLVQYRMYFEIIPIGISVIASLSKMYDILVPAQEAATAGQEEMNVAMGEGIVLEDILTFGIGALVGAVAGYAAATYLSGVSSTTSSPSISSPPSLQAGAPSGVPFTGVYSLEAGEVVTPTGDMESTGIGATTGGGINIYVYLEGDASDFLQVTAVEYEYENQRRGPVGFGR
jgi:hypothetical protein